MAIEVSTDNFADALMGLLKQYTDDVTSAVEAEVERTAEAVLNEIKATAPKDPGIGKKRRRNKKTRYANSFKLKEMESYNAGEKRLVIYSGTHYRRTHLLEFGHAKRNGGRVAGRPHIRPAYDKHVAGLEDRIKRIIENGGKGGGSIKPTPVGE